MLCDALENKGPSPSGVSYNPEVYTYAEKYRKLLEQVRTKSIGYTDMWIQLRQMERDTTSVAKNQRHRIAKIVNALGLYIKKEYNRVQNLECAEVGSSHGLENRSVQKWTIVRCDHAPPKFMKKIWTIWKYTIGSFSDDKTADYDDQVAVLRTIIVFVNFITCLFIMANIVHNW